MAHNYSANKLTFLRNARDFFSDALETLPRPFSTTTETKRTKRFRMSYNGDIDILDRRSDFETPVHQGGFLGYGGNRDTDTSLSMLTSSTDYSYVSRLTSSLSSNHLLTPELVPSPLFGRKEITSEKDQTPSHVHTPRLLPPLPIQQSHQVCLPNRDHCSTHVDRAEYFSGSDRTPQRKTAIQTLISKYEDKLTPITPSSVWSQSSFSTITTNSTQKLPLHIPVNFAPSSPYFRPTPITPRFLQIQQIFEPKLPVPSVGVKDGGSLNCHQPPSSDHTVPYENILAGFRDLLRTHIASVNDQIRAAQEIQAQRHTNKLAGASQDHKRTNGMGQREASYWSFSPAKSTVPRKTVRVCAMGSDHDMKKQTCEDIDRRVRQMSPASFSSPTPAPKRHHRVNRHGIQSAGDGTNNNARDGQNRNRLGSASTISQPNYARKFLDEQTRFRNSRLINNKVGAESRCAVSDIESLRANKFECVNKEVHGWKGQDYYDELVKCVEREIGGLH